MKEVNSTLLFLRQDDNVLLAMKKRGFGQGKWNGVGGKLDPGETVEQAMIRETKEEIGVTPIVYKQMAQIAFDEYNKGEPERMNVSVFVAEEWEGTPIETEEMMPKWFNIDEIPYEQMFEDDKYWLKTILGGQAIKAYVKFDENFKILSCRIEEVDGF